MINGRDLQNKNQKLNGDDHQKHVQETSDSFYSGDEENNQVRDHGPEQNALGAHSGP